MSYHAFIGIDIGKFEFVVAHTEGKAETYDNDAQGWSSFFRTISKS